MKGLLKRLASASLVLVALAALAGASARPAQAQPVPYGAYCCDGYAVRRCALDFLSPVGASCFCRGRGWGWVCM